MDEGERDHKWQASLDTDILEYLRQDGIPTNRQGTLGENRILYNLGSLLNSMYGDWPNENLRTIGDLTQMTKAEFTYCIDLLVGRHYRKDDREEYWSLLNSLLQKHGLKMNENTWQANSDTDIQEFLKKEGIPTNRKGTLGGNRILYNLGSLLGSMYGDWPKENLRTIGDLTQMTKAEFTYCIDLLVGRHYRKEDRKEYWSLLNSLLQKHGLKMNVKGKKT